MAVSRVALKAKFLCAKCRAYLAGYAEDEDIVCLVKKLAVKGVEVFPQ